jgi:diaminohydroxyphosphoribosylaminopyrimidine deaminase/5-amino-6-(5-phosphoribosylamino)uracil reductase
MVGAVVVKHNRVIATGYHRKAGLPHAEIEALNNAGVLAKGATLYVTLEPCVHFGKTPPCTERIIQSGIKRVVIGMIDPNPLNNGQGIERLKQHGIEIRAGFLERELSRLNEAFIKYISEKRPFVTVKIAQSLDGKIATCRGDSRWITSDKSRNWSHYLRSNYDAVMVGVNTVLRDNPKLDAWGRFGQRPAKIIVDSHLSTPCEANIFLKESRVIIATLPTGKGQETENRSILSQKAQILEVKERDGQVNLRDLLKKLAHLGISSILVEGGGTLLGSLFDEALVDKVLFFIAPKIIGGKEAISSVMGKGVLRIEKAKSLKDIKLRRIGEDFLIEGYVR